jgi:hypothetical protein
MTPDRIRLGQSVRSEVLGQAPEIDGAVPVRGYQAAIWKERDPGHAPDSGIDNDLPENQDDCDA